jgi:hypothetical protein
MTIADVALNYQDAASYRALVEEWARVTVQEMQPLIDTLLGYNIQSREA